MEPFTKMTSKVAVLNRTNVDTDQIIPKQFLKRIERTGYGKFAFFDWRYLENGQENPEFELNHPSYHGAQILLAGANFGCGSSREHAPWALLDYGFKVIIAPSFADIFYQNCLKNGILPIRVNDETMNYLLAKAEGKSYQCTVDLEKQLVTDDEGFSFSFDIDHHWKEMLLNGRDEIAFTLLYEDDIQQYEAKRKAWV
ncbi:3-isopropylmalate dehydratase small subunit [Bacillus alveayuensis]|jgi:3-isopropylmalate/(R)-2-methylmalate dehydratase small subunit|uniref:3-isopropylmalate dehydratase small subunit n=1 Tax=Aeribacillus alveayuensis TaxID=279215 RepID=UPI0005D0F01B|nr:3-isopropylmalate dehydratase small subunit [Bacillus alveayuensis]